MARYRADDADKYGGSGGIFFSLPADRSKALVRIMYNTIDDFEGVSVHELEEGNRRIMVDCLRNYNDPVETCPFCAAKMRVIGKVFIPLYMIEEDTVRLWERSAKAYRDRISGFCARFSPLVDTPFEIERYGAKGDNGTRYEFYSLAPEPISWDDLPPIPDVFSEGIVLSKTVDEMNSYLDRGAFPTSGATARNPASDRRGSTTAAPTNRRTSVPASSSRRPASPARRPAGNSGGKSPF